MGERFMGDIEAALRKYHELAKEQDRHKKIYRINYYKPYPKQMEFHNAIGKGTSQPASQRLLLGGNQIGKTFCGAMETAIHLTGRYPEWWRGTRFNYPVDVMVGSNTNETCRDIVQRELFGNPLDEKELGTGTIPIDTIGKTHRKAGVPNAIDSCTIKHVSGRNSKVYLRAYEQGFKKFMGIRFEVGWLDEEPPQDIWSQFIRAGLSRENSILYITMTPEEGMTKVVSQFMNEPQLGQAMVQAGWNDAAHFTTEMKEQRLAAFPKHEREMRSQGTPLMGAGLVFDTPEDQIIVEPFEIPRHWPQIVGIDFGWDHPFGAVKLAWDRESDCVYITNVYRESRELPIVQAEAIKSWGEWVPIAWPHDGLNTEKGTGEQLRQAYVNAGLNLLPWKATNAPQSGQLEGEGGNSVEASILEMVERENEGRLKVFSNCKVYFDERRMYHRDLKAKLVKENDDVISAARYGIMMIRHARTVSVAPRRIKTAVGASNWS